MIFNKNYSPNTDLKRGHYDAILSNGVMIHCTLKGGRQLFF